MSHISRIKTQLMEKAYLLEAIEDLGYTYEVGNLKLSGMTESVAVDVKVHLRMSFDIGLHRTDHGYEIIADWWGVRGVSKKEFTEKLTQRYAYRAACARLAEQGFALASEETKASGEIHLVMRRIQ